MRVLWRTVAPVWSRSDRLHKLIFLKALWRFAVLSDLLNVLETVLLSQNVLEMRAIFVEVLIDVIRVVVVPHSVLHHWSFSSCLCVPCISIFISLKLSLHSLIQPHSLSKPIFIRVILRILRLNWVLSRSWIHLWEARKHGYWHVAFHQLVVGSSASFGFFRTLIDSGLVEDWKFILRIKHLRLDEVKFLF